MDLQQLKERIERNKQKSLEATDGGFFSLYLSHYNLKKGLDKVPTHLLYYSYFTFIAHHKEELPLSKGCFFKELKKHFKAVRWGKQRYYLIDKSSILNIDDSMEFRANLWKKSQVTTKEKN
jgi:hypothetical protein